MFASVIGHRLWAPLALAAVAALALIPDCGSPGLWEPQELAVADRAVARVDAERAAYDAKPDAKPDAKASRSCKDAPDADADGEPDPGGARSLTDSAATLGFSWFGTDRGMRLPLELLGLLTVLAAAGVAYRLRGPRAALLAGLVCLSFPLLALQSRQLTSEIGTAAGGALLCYGLAFPLRPAPGRWAILDGLVAALGVGLGAWIGFLGGGALLGVLVPLGAFALASGGGLALVVGLYRVAIHGVRRLADGRSGRSGARFVLFPLALLPARPRDLRRRRARAVAAPGPAPPGRVADRRRRRRGARGPGQPDLRHPRAGARLAPARRPQHHPGRLLLDRARRGLEVRGQPQGAGRRRHAADRGRHVSVGHPGADRHRPLADGRGLAPALRRPADRGVGRPGVAVHGAVPAQGGLRALRRLPRPWRSRSACGSTS